MMVRYVSGGATPSLACCSNPNRERQKPGYWSLTASFNEERGKKRRLPLNRLCRLCSPDIQLAPLNDLLMGRHWPSSSGMQKEKNRFGPAQSPTVKRVSFHRPHLTLLRNYGGVTTLSRF